MDPLPRLRSSSRAWRSAWRSAQTGFSVRAGQQLQFAKACSRSFPSSGGRFFASEVGVDGALGTAEFAKIAAALAAVGGLAWAVAPMFSSAQDSKSSEASSRATLLPVSDEIFDNQDNLFVFFLDQPEEVLGRRADIEQVMQRCLAESSLHHVRFFHNVRKDEDPPVPEVESSAETTARKPIKVVMYKGQRKTVINIGDEVPIQKIIDFYMPVTEAINPSVNKKYAVPKVSNQSFVEDVINASSPEHWILLQLFEDTCFLCFLMRPFVNSVSILLAEQGMPFTIKRLNVEKNDFPDRCPVARGTPTFVLFRGSQFRPEKWEEFKPKDFIDKLRKELPPMDESVYATMEEYQNLVSRRFQLFTQLVFWTVELQKLQALLCAVAPQPERQAENDDTDFNTVVSQMMTVDMKRADGISDNLKHLQHEVEEVEHDAAIMGMMLAESIAKRETQQEATSWTR